MNTKEQLYAVIGGGVGAILTMVVCSFSPLGAQSKAENLGDIVCENIRCSGISVNGSMMLRGGSLFPEESNLTVRDGKVFIGSSATSGGGSASMGIGKSGGGYVLVVAGGENSARARMDVGEYSGRVRVYGNSGREVRAGMSSNEDGGRIYVRGKGDVPAKAIMIISKDGGGGKVTVYRKGGASGGSASLGTDEHGGNVYALGKDGGMASMVIDEGENGGIARVSVRDIYALGKDGGMAGRQIRKHGGRVYVQGNGSSKGQAVMGVNEYGNGAVSTWDKNGYRQ